MQAFIVLILLSILCLSTQITLVDNRSLKTTLLEEIDESQLPAIYGGQLPLVPIHENWSSIHTSDDTEHKSFIYESLFNLSKQFTKFSNLVTRTLTHLKLTLLSGNCLKVILSKIQLWSELLRSNFLHFYLLSKE